MSIEKLTTQLRIVRGRFGEIMAMPTTDMEFYLAWDTQELFVGNKKGVKVPYGAGTGLSENAATLLVESLISGQFELVNSSIDTVNSDLDIIRGQIVTVNSDLIIERGRIDLLNGIITTIQGNISGDIEAAVNTFLTSEAGELFMTKDEVINELIKHTYSKLEIENQINSRAKQVDLDALGGTVEKYSSIELVEVPLGQTDIEIITAKADGVYRLGNLIYTKDNGKISKLNSDGYIYLLTDGEWVKIQETDIIPEPIEPIEFPISADNISDSLTKKWNTLLPDEDGAVNKFGRSTSITTTGINSTAIGLNSAATAESSTSLGNAAKALAQGAVQLGEGENSNAYSLKFRDYELLTSSGQIPSERLQETFITRIVNITVSEWDFQTKTAIKAVEGVSPNSIVWCSPAINTFDTAVDAGVICIAQGLNTLTFRCDVVPSVPVSMNIVIKVVI